MKMRLGWHFTVQHQPGESELAVFGPRHEATVWHGTCPRWANDPMIPATSVVTRTRVLRTATGPCRYCGSTAH